MAKGFYGPKDPRLGKKQAAQLQREKEAAERKADRDNLKFIAERAKQKAEKLARHKERVQELVIERQKRQAIERRYLNG